MKGLVLTVSTIFLVAGTQIILNLQPEAEITVESLSPYQLEEMGLTSHPSQGLGVVGIGELVYLSGSDAEGEDVISYAWSIDPAPTSTATLDSVGTEWNTFRADVQGDYTINLTVTTASGSSDASIVITAAVYAGVETGQCGTCHFNTKNTWALTGHSDFFTKAIDGLESDHYGESCIECHTVGYNTDPEAVNGGFDDVAASSGWTFPAVLQDGNWADIVANYPALADKANIQCENCHGPASQHSPFNPDGNNRLDVSLGVGVCGRCHGEAPYHKRAIQWEESAHALGTSFARGVSSSSCAPCHNGWGFIDRWQDKSTGGKFWEAGLPEENISCAVCHDPHMSTEEGDHQLRTIADFTLVNGVTITAGGNGKICMACHQARREADEYVTSFSGGTFRGAHHSVQTDVIFGQNAHTFGRVLPNSTHKDATPDACVTCHMYPTPGEGLGMDKVGDHTFGVTYVDDMDNRVDNVAACERCHGVFDSFSEFMSRNDDDGDGEVEPVQEEIHGLLENVAMLLPPEGTTDILPGNDPFWAAPENLIYRKALWNYLMMEEEGSFGIHNYQYSVAVLKLTAQALEFGVLDAGMIMGIEDVPNDQGRQVGVAWNRFGGDGASDTPLQDYYVWRKVEDPGAGKVAEEAYASFNDVPVVTDESEVSISSLSVVVDNELWTAVGHQPAAALPLYSAVVPTLGDATEADTVWSTFVVSGHVAGAPDLTIISEPAVGYSVDNLVPTAPMMSAATMDLEVELTFELDVEAYRNTDFNYFAIYRSTEAGFNPEGMEPMATTAEDVFVDTDVVNNTTYYYRVAAYDFSGNQGEFSDQVMAAVVVGLDGTGEIPVDFELYQNYPNPFNPSTTIAFDVPRTSDVSVAVYDLLGRQVRMLVSGSLPAGKHQVTLNAQGMSSGLYVVRFETPEKAFERTILLIK